jgi:hypothetical protein
MCGLCWAAGVGCVWHEAVLLVGVSGVVVMDVGDQCVVVVVFGAVLQFLWVDESVHILGILVVCRGW